MFQARLFELGVVGLNLFIVLIAVAIGAQVSVLMGVCTFVVLTLGSLPMIFNFDYPLVRQMLKSDDQVMLNLCRSGFVGRSRRLLGGLPASPRCRFCMVPFSGIGRLLGIRPSAKNPNYCRSCFEGLPTETHELEVGVLFADIRGFTSWAESHSTEEASAVLTRFYSTANEALTDDDAFVEFVGDQVMAIYIVAMPSLGDRTATIMLEGARRLVAMVRKETDLLPVGVGLNLGVAQVGALAKGESKDFTAVGDVVNTAARLQACAGEFEIVLSETAYAAVTGNIPEARPTTLDLKGKAESQNAYVLGALE